MEGCEGEGGAFSPVKIHVGSIRSMGSSVVSDSLYIVGEA